MNGILARVSSDWALFLDVDGTLVDLAPTPGTIEVHADLPPLLGRLARRAGGSLALVSGRTLADLDRLFHPFRFPAAGIHGSERRDALGKLHFTGLTSADLAPVRTELRRFVAQHPDLLLEDKGRGLALHFRQAPELEPAVRELLERVRVHLPADAHLQPGHCVIELKGGASNKRAAVEQFMREPPFEGRVPIYVGDDLTDLDALEYVESLGGQGIFVGPQSKPGYGWLPDPRAVREWLRSLDPQ
ncbi:MAG TPA: trehalose-phosphatase [Steroidobacteraceae bacterium]|nr:trehalose-phosphatase [Steroidobacteraceae bacterium]